MSKKQYIACDLGAESGRVIIGTLEDERLTLDEVYRFPNGAVDSDGTLRWELPRIFEELKRGLAQAAERGGHGLEPECGFLGGGLCPLQRGRPTACPSLQLP